jgi:type VI secretion system protein ImpL
MAASSGLIEGIISSIPSLPLMIGIVLAVAFIAMLAVTIGTLVSMKRAEMRVRKVVDLPPSAMKKDNDRADVDDINAKAPPPVGEWFNRYLIGQGYIKVHSIVRSFFKAMDFLKSSLGNGYKYKLPWFLMVGTSESGKSSLLSGFTQDEFFDEDDDDEADLTWWFLKNGVVLDVKGDVLLPKDGLKANEKSWSITLNMLVRYRSEKPINGILLTIPANELYGKNKLSADEVKKRASFISRKLNFAQNFLGLKLPVYVVITKTDLVPGFQSFCSEIPVRNRNNMLGWSCPYPIDAMYHGKWVEEAFESIEDELNEIRMEILSEGGVTTTRDGIFVFPSELLTVRDNLSFYLDSIFRSGSAEERFYLRGLYFTGDSKMVPLLPFSGEDASAIMGTPDADVNQAGSLTASFRSEEFAPKKIFFFEDLICRKVFLEGGIASPIRSKVHQSNKSILVAKVSTAAFVLIGSYGLFSARDSLKRSMDNLYPALFKVSSIIRNADTLTMKNLERSGNEVLSRCTSQLLAMMQQLNNAKFSSLFVPASWFSNINSELTETLRISYQRVVVRTIYMNLILKARSLLSMKPSAEHSSKSINELLNPYNSKEYALMKSYVSGLIEIEKNIKKFDSLRTSGDPKDLEDLIDFTFQGSLPKEFLNNYDQFRRILMNTPFPPIDLSPYRKVAFDVLLNLFQNFIDAIFSDKSGGSIISFLNMFIDNLNKQNIEKVPDCKEFLKFAGDLTNVCKELGEEGSTWLDSQVFKVDDEYNRFLDDVEALFGKDTTQQFLDTTAYHFDELKKKLKEFNKMVVDEDEKKPDEEVPISHGIFVMAKALAGLCKASYMKEPGKYKLITEIPEGKMIYWDDELVQYAYEMSKKFEQFAATAIKDFPKSMQEGVMLLAKTNLCAVIASTIAKSQSFVEAPSALTDELTSEEILQKQVAELKGVAPKFVSLLKILRDDNVNFVFSDLRTVLNKIGFSLLDHIDNLLENQKPYMPQNLSFSYWDGEIGASYKAYSASDDEELKLYLQLQRKLVMRLAIEFAEPIVQFLKSDVVFDQNFGNHGQLTKWIRIVDGVKGLQTRDPANPVTMTERFIIKTLNSYNLDNITTEIPLSDIKGESSEYFTNLVRQIKKGIMARAEVLIRQRNINRYNTLRDFYGKHLINKYPFSGYDKSQRSSVDADLESVKQFFKMYDEFGGTPERVLDQIYQLGEDSKEMYEFIKKVHILRQFCGDFVNSQYDTPKVKLEIDFNLNKRGEANVGYLVDRVFKPNHDSNIEFISEDKSAVWYFAEPIQIIFRWAEGDDNAEKPTFDQNDPDIIIENTKATVECVGNWSVLRFLQKYKSEGTGADKLLANQNLLNFKIPLSNGKTASIYAAVTASLPQKPEDPSVTTLALPMPPGNMPEINQKVVALSNVPTLVERASVHHTVSGSVIEEEEEEKQKRK